VLSDNIATLVASKGKSSIDMNYRKTENETRSRLPIILVIDNNINQYNFTVIQFTVIQFTVRETERNAAAPSLSQS